MTTIILPPDREGRLAEEASRRGTTLELLALDGLRRLFSPKQVGSESAETLFEFLGAHLGAVDGKAELLSENCGRPFADGLLEKQERVVR